MSTWSRGGYRCKVAASDGTLWATESIWCGFTVTTTPDTTPPVTGTDYDGLWHGTPFAVNLGARDEQGGWGMQGGYAKTEYSRDGGSTWVTGSTVTYSGKRGGSGVHTLLYRSTDTAGSLEETKRINVLIDARPPLTTNDAPLVPQGGDVTVHLTAADSLAGVIACSGVKETWCSLDGGV